MFCKSTHDSVVRRMTALKNKFDYLMLDISLVTHVNDLQSFFQLPSGITPEEWNCEPDFRQLVQGVNDGKAAIIAVWDDGQKENVIARLVDDLNVFSRIDHLEKLLPPKPTKKKFRTAGQL